MYNCAFVCVCLSVCVSECARVSVYGKPKHTHVHIHTLYIHTRTHNVHIKTQLCLYMSDQVLTCIHLESLPIAGYTRSDCALPHSVLT